MKKVLMAILVSAFAVSEPADAVEMEGPGVTNFVNAEVGGWHLQCKLQLANYDSPSQCVALFDLADGNVALRYSKKGLEVATIGRCGEGNSSAPVQLPVTDIAKLIEDAARNPSSNCKPPVLTADLFQSLPEVNTIATLLVQRQP